jgi:hypothetical protein
MTFPGTKVRVAKKEYPCADCCERSRVSRLAADPRTTIKPGDEYVIVNEYGEQRKLHRACGELRASRHQEKSS